MTPEVFLSSVIDPGLALLQAQGGPSPSDPARVFLLAIALQESGPTLVNRYQGSPAPTAGPARGFWQFEIGGTHGVLNHPAVKGWADAVCAALTIQTNEQAAWRALEGNDLLASCLARLLVYTNPGPLPTSEAAGWDQYENLWRPGAPRPNDWSGNWQTAQAAVGTSSA